MRTAIAIELDADGERLLSKLANPSTVSVREACRAKIVLLAMQGKTDPEIAETLGIGRVQAGRWRDRYAREGISSIEKDWPRGGRKKQIDAQGLCAWPRKHSPLQSLGFISKIIGLTKLGFPSAQNSRSKSTKSVFFSIMPTNG